MAHGFRVDELNDAELERVSEMLALRKAMHAMHQQREWYEKGHARRMAQIAAEISTAQAKLDALNGGAS